MPSTISRRMKSALLITLLAVLAAGCSKPSAEASIAAAQRHIAEKKFNAAQIELRNAIQQAPNNGLAYRLLGDALLRLGDPVAAEAALRKALTLGETADATLPHLALSLLGQDQPQKLIEEFGAVALQDATAQAAMKAALGQAWLIRGELKPATESFTASLAIQPRQPAALLGRARIAAHEGKLDEALVLSESALTSDTAFAEAYMFKGQLLISKGQRELATEALDKALAADASFLPARLALASIYLDAKDYAKAKTVLEAPGSAARDPRAQFLQALLALRQNDIPKAKDTIAGVLKAAPEYGAALALAGEIELRSGNLALADQHLSKAMRLNASPGVRRLLAATQLRQSRPAKALETLQPLLQDTGTRDSAVAMLAGEAYLANGDVRRAGEFFEAAKAAGGNEALARTRLGQLMLRKGDVERGEQELVVASSLSAQSTEPELLLFSLHLRRNELVKALAAAQAIIKKQPQNPMGPVLAGTAQAMQRDRAAARQSFEAALKLKPDHVPALRALADLDVAEGKAVDAQKRYDALLAKKPDDDQLLLAVANLQERTGRGDDAVKTLRKAVSANPKARDAVVALAQQLLRRKDAAGALEVAQEAVRNNPDEMSLAMLLGAAQEAAGASKDALRTLSALVLKEPNATAPLVRLAQLQARQRDYDGAATTLSRALERAPNNDALVRDLAAVYLQAGKPDQALKVSKDLQVRKPESAVGHLLEGEVRASAKKWPEAERAYRAALKVDPRSGVAAGKVFSVLHAAGKPKDADGFAAQWTADHPNDIGMRLLVADRALKSRQFAAAIQQYEAALRVQPEQPLVLNNLAWALGQVKDPKAIPTAERAAALAPNSPDVLDTLGMLQLQGGDPKKGLETMQRVRDLAPNRPELRLHYAKALLQNGRTQEGKAELRELATAKAEFPGKADIPALLAAQ